MHNWKVSKGFFLSMLNHSKAIGMLFSLTFLPKLLTLAIAFEFYRVETCTSYSGELEDPVLKDSFRSAMSFISFMANTVFTEAIMNKKREGYVSHYKHFGYCTQYMYDLIVSNNFA
jgi:hypothetical protein